MDGHSGLGGRPIGILNDNMYYLTFFSGDVFGDTGEIRRNGNRFMSDDDVERVSDPFLAASRTDVDGGIVGGDGRRMDLAMLDIQASFLDAGVTFGTGAKLLLYAPKKMWGWGDFPFFLTLLSIHKSALSRSVTSPLVVSVRTSPLIFKPTSGI